ncbi:hypothetical protein DYB25_003601 [Aphanomyces astaci]|uniref:Protein kinase domain-containing protein n=3 Tax=Aphanomyces astaci TaxID=112090 RepID=A0A397BDX2_APHAT|nr:hypothetical protein DYB25_003601 [Aphanomyces astaci]
MTTSDLFAAISNGQPELVLTALKLHDVYVNGTKLINRVLYTPLMLAAELGKADIVRILLARPETQVNRVINAKKSPTPLHLASLHGHIDVVKALLDMPQVDVNATMEVGSLLLEYVAPYLSASGLVYMLSKDLPIMTIEETDFEVRDELAKQLVVVANPDHQFSWAAFLDPSIVQVNDSIAKEAIAMQVVDFFVASNSKDKHNRSVLATADHSVAMYLKRQLYFGHRYEIADGPPVHQSATSVVVQATDHGMYSQVFDDYADAADGCGLLNEDKFLSCIQTLHNVTSALLDGKVTIDAFHDLTSVTGTDCMDWLTFRSFCEQTYGPHVQVAIKFVKHHADYLNELESRRGLSCDYVVGLLPNPKNLSVLHSLPLSGTSIDLASYPHALVLPAGSRSLADIFRHERPRPSDTCRYVRQVAAALWHLHNKGLVHGNVTMDNILRYTHVKLIDLAATTKVGTPALGNAKVTSGILPPEMFYMLANDAEYAQYVSYWHTVGGFKDDDLLQPHSNVVVRSFRHIIPDDQDHHMMLPYQLVPSSPAQDAWALGCLMFEMVSGMQLVPTNRDQEILPRFKRMAATWTDQALHKYIHESVLDDVARELLCKLLVVDPAQRLSMDQVVAHRYFDVQVAATGDDRTREGIVRAAAQRHLLT